MDATSIPFDQFLDIVLDRADRLRAAGITRIKYGDNEMNLDQPIQLVGEKIGEDHPGYRKLPRGVLDDPETFPGMMPSYPRRDQEIE